MVLIVVRVLTIKSSSEVRKFGGIWRDACSEEFLTDNILENHEKLGSEVLEGQGRLIRQLVDKVEILEGRVRGPATWYIQKETSRSFHLQSLKSSDPASDRRSSCGARSRNSGVTSSEVFDERKGPGPSPMLQLQRLHQWLCNDVHKLVMDFKIFQIPEFMQFWKDARCLPRSKRRSFDLE